MPCRPTAGEDSHETLAVDLLRGAVATPLDRPTPGDGLDRRVRFTGGILDAAGMSNDRSRLSRRGIVLQVPTRAGVVQQRRPGRSLYGGIWFDHYGHFLLETLARAWHLVDTTGPVVFHRPADRSGEPIPGTMKAWQRELVAALLGDPSRVGFLTAATEFEELVVPEAGCVLGERCTRAQAAALAQVGSRLRTDLPAPPTPPAPHGRKLWLSRSRLVRGRVVGERGFETTLRAAGFDVLHPETLPLGEQVRALDEASIVAGFTGSAFHTALLAGSRRAELIHFARFTAANQSTFVHCAAAAGYRSRFYDCFVGYDTEGSVEGPAIGASLDVHQDFEAVWRRLQETGDR